MKFSQFLVAATLMLSVGCTGYEANRAPEALETLDAVTLPESFRVHETFNTWKQAVLNDNGVLAYSLLDRRTRNHWDEIFHDVIHVNEKDFLELRFYHKFKVVEARQIIPHERLKLMNGQALFEHEVNNAWIAKGVLSNTTLRDVVISQNFAIGKALINNETDGRFDFHFYKENGSWKMNLTELYTLSEMDLIQQRRSSGKTEEEFIFERVYNFCGKPVDSEAIYFPPAQTINPPKARPNET